MSNPVITLSLFALICVVLFLLFRSGKGYYWRLKRELAQDDKIVTEDILKQLYHAEYEGHSISITNLKGLFAEHNNLLDVIKSMEAKGLIGTTEGVVKLNDEGRDYALKIIRVHRLWEKYLSEKTGYHKSEWHDRAEEMEHQLTSEEANKLAVQLGNPRFDPHGDPIPTDTGEITKIKGVPLSLIPVNTIGRITHIEDEPDVIYKQILAERLHIASQVRVVESNERRVVFHSQGEEYILAPVVAANITVLALEREEISEENISRLSSLKGGEKAKIIGISQECRGENRRRLLDLGFVKNTDISIGLESPMRNPKAYLVRDTAIAIRNEQADFVLIEKIGRNE